MITLMPKRIEPPPPFIPLGGLYQRLLAQTHMSPIAHADGSIVSGAFESFFHASRAVSTMAS